MQADSDVDALVERQLAVPLGQTALKDAWTLNRINHACELSEKPIAHQLEDAAVMLLDLRLEQLLAMRPQAFECALLVLLHEPAIADYIGSYDGRELALHSNSNLSDNDETAARQCYAKRPTKASPVRVRS